MANPNLDFMLKTIPHLSLEDCAKVIDVLVETVSDELGSADSLEDAAVEIRHHIRKEGN